MVKRFFLRKQNFKRDRKSGSSSAEFNQKSKKKHVHEILASNLAQPEGHVPAIQFQATRKQQFRQFSALAVVSGR